MWSPENGDWSMEYGEENILLPCVRLSERLGASAGCFAGGASKLSCETQGSLTVGGTHICCPL